jgi:hypothetical protein
MMRRSPPQVAQSGALPSLSLPCFHHSGDQTEIEGVGWMLTLLAPQLVIDESGYGQNGPTETFVFAGFIEEVHQWEDFADYWEPIMNEKRPWTAKTLTKSRQKRSSVYSSVG